MDNFIDMELANLILPTSFEDALTYEQQVIWLCLHKQDLLVEGENITITENEDGTATITAGGSTYRIDAVEPESGYTAAYALIDVKTEQQMGETIQIPTVAGPEGPEGPQGEDGVGIESIDFKEEDEDGNYVYTVTLTDETKHDITCPIGPEGLEGPQGETGPQGPAGQGVPTGGTAGQVLTKRSGTNYDTEWVTPSSGGGSGMNLRCISGLFSDTADAAWRIESGAIITSSFNASMTDQSVLDIKNKMWQNTDGSFASRELSNLNLSLRVKLASGGATANISNNTVVFKVTTGSADIYDSLGSHDSTEPFLNGTIARQWAYILFIDGSNNQYFVPAKIECKYNKTAGTVTITGTAVFSTWVTEMTIPAGNYEMFVYMGSPTI